MRPLLRPRSEAKVHITLLKSENGLKSPKCTQDPHSKDEQPNERPKYEHFTLIKLKMEWDFWIYKPQVEYSSSSSSFQASQVNKSTKMALTHTHTQSARVSICSSRRVLGTREAELRCLYRVQTLKLGFLSRQHSLVESALYLAESAT